MAYGLHLGGLHLGGLHLSGLHLGGLQLSGLHLGGLHRGDALLPVSAGTTRWRRASVASAFPRTLGVAHHLVPAVSLVRATGVASKR